jgi:hypothetical protein
VADPVDDVRARVARLDSLLAGVDAIADDGARAAATDAVHALVALHADAMTRVVDRIRDTAPNLVDALADDELVGLVLLSLGAAPELGEGPEEPGAPAAPGGDVFIPLESIGRRQGPADEHERCDLCSEPLPTEHRHLLDLADGRVACACRACTILFDRAEAGGDHYRLIPERHADLGPDALDDMDWAMLGVPVDLAFFVQDSRAGGVAAHYPSPAGTTTATVDARAWADVAGRVPDLRDLVPDVEALLVHRARGAREHWIVPIDDCYRLAGLITSRWQGMTGGRDLWAAVDEFFGRLGGRVLERS